MILDTLKYFATFVPLRALHNFFLYNGGDDYVRLKKEILSERSERRIDAVTDYLFGINNESLRRRISSITGIYLLVDYANITSTINTTDCKKDTLHFAVTVAAPHPSDEDWVNEALLQQKCLDILTAIRRAMRNDWRDSDQTHWLVFPTTIAPFSSRELANSFGWTMEFDIEGVDIV